MLYTATFEDYSETFWVHRQGCYLLDRGRRKLWEATSLQAACESLTDELPEAIFCADGAWVRPCEVCQTDELESLL